jgi:hypothetical protein
MPPGRALSDILGLSLRDAVAKGASASGDRGKGTSVPKPEGTHSCYSSGKAMNAFLVRFPSRRRRLFLSLD